MAQKPSESQSWTEGGAAAADGHLFPSPVEGALLGGSPAMMPDPAPQALGMATPAPRLRRFYVYQLLSVVHLTEAIWIIYLAKRGFSLSQIGLAEAIFHLAPISLELVTGSLADTFGRKWSLVLGSLCTALSAFLMLQATELWVVAIAMYVGGAGYTFRSGAQEAFLYDTLAEGGGSDRFTGVFGRLLSLNYVLIALTAWLGATLAGVSFTWPYALMVGVSLAAATVASGLREPERDRVAHRHLGRTIVEALAVIRANPPLAALLIYNAALWTCLTLIGLYGQAVLSELGLSTPTVGLVIGSTLLFTAVGAWLSPWITRRGDFRAWTVGLSLVLVAGGLGLGSEILALGIGLYFAAELAAGIYEPILMNRINTGATAAQRATIISFNGLLFSLTMIWAFPLGGWVAQRWSWLAMYSGAAAVVLLVLAVWLIVSARERPPGGGGSAAPVVDPG